MKQRLSQKWKMFSSSVKEKSNFQNLKFLFHWCPIASFGKNLFFRFSSSQNRITSSGWLRNPVFSDCNSDSFYSTTLKYLSPNKLIRRCGLIVESLGKQDFFADEYCCACYRYNALKFHTTITAQNSIHYPCMVLFDI